MQEQRRHQRAPLQTPVLIATAEATLEGTAADISIGGMFVEVEEAPPFGAEVTLTMTSPIDDRVKLTLPAKVRWTRTGGMGLQFGLLGAVETHAIVEYLRARQG